MIRRCALQTCGECVECLDRILVRHVRYARAALWAVPLLVTFLAGVLLPASPIGLGLVVLVAFLTTQVGFSGRRRVSAYAHALIADRRHRLLAFERARGPCSFCGLKFVAVPSKGMWLLTNGLWLCPRCRPSREDPEARRGRQVLASLQSTPDDKDSA